MTPQHFPKRLYEITTDHLQHYRLYALDRLQYYRNLLFQFINRYWFRLLVTLFFITALCIKDIKIELSLQNRTPLFAAAEAVSMQDKMTLLPDLAKSTTENIDNSKRQKQLKYIKRFAKVAQAEMNKFGIPASITLAQGLLETNAGDSPLAANMNNHFGIKCFSKKCAKGHCANFSDDSHKDFFRIYKTAWESFRAHSQLLQNQRYQNLYQFSKDDYKNWAVGLKKAGYATDKRYPEKLIRLIETLNLNKYDV